MLSFYLRKIPTYMIVFIRMKCIYIRWIGRPAEK